MAQVADCLLGIEHAGAQGGARIVGKAGEERVHPFDFRVLIIHHIAGEFIHYRVCCGALLAVQFLHHGNGALVVAHHHFQEQPVEIGAARDSQCFHLLRCRHADHARMRGVAHARHFQRLAAIRKPAAHEIYLVLLRGVDPARHGQDFRRVGAIFHQRRHVHGLLVVHDHALHEGYVRRGIGVARQLRRLVLAQRARGLAHGAGLHDGNFLRGYGGGAGKENCRERGSRRQAKAIGHVLRSRNCFLAIPLGAAKRPLVKPVPLTSKPPAPAHLPGLRPWE